MGGENWNEKCGYKSNTRGDSHVKINQYVTALFRTQSIKSKLNSQIGTSVHNSSVKNCQQNHVLVRENRHKDEVQRC